MHTCSSSLLKLSKSNCSRILLPQVFFLFFLSSFSAFLHSWVKIIFELILLQNSAQPNFLWGSVNTAIFFIYQMTCTILQSFSSLYSRFFFLKNCTYENPQWEWLFLFLFIITVNKSIFLIRVNHMILGKIISKS